MAVTALQTGTVSPSVGGAEVSLGSTIVTPGTYQLFVDAFNMSNGDVVELRIYVKPNSTAVERLAYIDSFANQQTTYYKISVPVAVAGSFRCTISQPSGTTRPFPFTVIQF